MKKINDLSVFFDERKKYHESLHKIYEHNTIFGRTQPEQKILTIKDLLEHSIKYPKALIVFENPKEDQLRTMMADTKFYFDKELEFNIQPIFLFKHIVSDENFIVLYNHKKPDLKNINENKNDSINKNDFYINGKKFIESEKEREGYGYHTDLVIFGYWVDDFYFEKNNWDSCFNSDNNYLHTYCSHKGNDNLTYILNPHY
jgi:hypothetical protein